MSLEQEKRRSKLDLLNLMKTMLAIIPSLLFVYDKLISFLILKKKEKIYNSMLHIHKLYKNDLIKNNEIFKRVILENNELDDLETLKKTYIRIILKEKDKVKLEGFKIELDNNFKLDNNNIKKLYEFMYEDAINVKPFKVKPLKYLKLFTGAGLIGAVLRNCVVALDKSSIDRNTIVGIMVGKRISRDSKAYALLAGSLMLYIILSVSSVIEFKLIDISFFLLLIGALALNQKMLEIRIKKGMYGTNPYEVKEIIQFIEEHSDKSDFIDGKKIKKLIQDPEEDENGVVVWDGVYQQ